MAVKAFIDTNFYCPRPSTGNTFIDGLWLAFVEKYTRHSIDILVNVLKTPHLQHLPSESIRKVSEETNSRRQGLRSEASGSGASGSIRDRGGVGSWRRGGRETSRPRVSSVWESGATRSHQVYTPAREASSGGSWRGGGGGSMRVRGERIWRGGNSDTDSL